MIRKIFIGYLAVILVFVAGLSSCGKDDEWGEVPREIANFIEQYYPGSAISSFSESDNTYHVRIKDGPGMTFGSDYSWIVVDGYGLPLPQVMLFDQLPPKLYGYLQDSQQLDSVFGMERDSSRYTLTMLNATLFYDIRSGEISGTTPTD